MWKRRRPIEVKVFNAVNVVKLRFGHCSGFRINGGTENSTFPFEPHEFAERFAGDSEPGSNTSRNL